MTEPGLNLSSSPARPHRPLRRSGDNLDYIGARSETRQIIRALEKVKTISGYRPEIVFGDWLAWLEAALITLPAHLESAVRTGQSRTPEVRTLYAQLRERYRPAGYVDRTDQIWDCFTTAFSVLVSGVRPGLWATYNQPDVGYLGPDVLGETYMAYSQYDPDWLAYTLIPWNEHLALVQTTPFNGEAEVLGRIKQACNHPDNIAGHTVLQEHPTVNQPEQVAEWLFNRVIPAAMPYYEPFSLCDAWAGTGARLLALALQFPDWAVLRGLVTFVALEPVEMCLRMCRINLMLYGLNGYYCDLKHSFAVSAKVCFQ